MLQTTKDNFSTATSPIHFEVIDSFAGWLSLGQLLKNVMEIHQIEKYSHV